MSLAAEVFAAARRSPARDALVCGGEKISYAALADKVRSTALSLRSHGVGPGDRVLLVARGDSPSFVYAYLAVNALGAVAVPVDRGLPSSGVHELAKLTGAKLVAPPIESASGGAFEPLTTDLDAASDILFTGGTTGLPKGVVQTWRGVRAFAAGRAAAVGSAEGERLVIPLPLSHGYGLSRLRAILMGGGTAILLDGFLAPGDLFRAFGDHGATSLCAVPSAFAALFELTGDEIKDYGERLRTIESATAPLLAAQIDRLLELLPGARLLNAYGMTETTSSIAYVDLRAAAGKRGTVGKAIPGLALKVEGGRVFVKGDSVMKGYWNDPEQTNAAIQDGWYEANDLGQLDADGYLTLTGRREELINVGGLKVAPAELEAVLRGHPAVSDCACAGMPDPSGIVGERVKAVIVAASGVPRPTSAELISWLRSRVEAYKVPAVFEWRESLPRTALGKLKRSELK